MYETTQSLVIKIKEETIQGSSSDTDTSNTPGSLQLQSYHDHETKTLQCNECDFTTVIPKNLLKHLDLHLKNENISEEETIQGSLSDTDTSNTPGNLQLQSHHDHETKTLQCNECDFTTVIPENLLKHLDLHLKKENISEEETIQGSSSDTDTSNTPGNLQLQSNHDHETKTLQCNECDFTTVKPEKLMKHLDLHLKKENISDDLLIPKTAQVYKCEMCEYESPHIQNVRRHYLAHTGHKPYVCTFCNYQTSHPSNLYKHIQSHTKEKTFECQTCDYKTIRKSTLQEHMRRHTGDKPYKCDECGFRTAQAGSLRRHVQLHSGTKTHECHLCLFKTARMDKLKLHLQVKHKT